MEWWTCQRLIWQALVGKIYISLQMHLFHQGLCDHLISLLILHRHVSVPTGGPEFSSVEDMSSGSADSNPSPSGLRSQSPDLHFQLTLWRAGQCMQQPDDHHPPSFFYNRQWAVRFSVQPVCTFLTNRFKSYKYHTALRSSTTVFPTLMNSIVNWNILPQTERWFSQDLETPPHSTPTNILVTVTSAAPNGTAVTWQQAGSLVH